MMEPFRKSFIVRWTDMDFNNHMRNTAYLDLAVEVRMMLFNERGLSMRELERMRIGPVVMRDEVEYFRELRLLETVNVTLSLAGLSSDASRMRLRNEFFREGERLVARITSTGGWLDLNARMLIRPPEKVVLLLRSLARAEDYQELPSSVS
jgi:acyl-CoA thioester hydrolase